MARGAKFSSVRSAQSISRRATSTPSGFLRLSATLRLPALSAENSELPSRPCGLPAATAMKRRNSGRERDSTRTTSAPCSAK